MDCSSVSRISARIFTFSMIVLVVFSAIALLMVYLRAYSWVEIFAYFAVGGLAGAGLSGAVRVLMGVLLSSQMRLQELLLTLFAAACVATPCAQRVRATEVDPEHTLEQMLGLPMMVFVLFFLGSAWAWNAARRLQETRSRPRLVLMLKGWLLCGGAIGALGVLLSLLFVAVERRMHSDVTQVFCICLPVTLLMVPGLLVERRVRASVVKAQEMKA